MISEITNNRASMKFLMSTNIFFTIVELQVITNTHIKEVILVSTRDILKNLQPHVYVDCVGSYYIECMYI